MVIFLGDETMNYHIKRIYEEPSEQDGFRILVDRLWPRGIKKEKANINLWMKEMAPPHELRKWFNHDPEKFSLFKEKYLHFLHTDEVSQKLIHEIKTIAKENQTVTLIYAAKDEHYNQAVILKELLTKEANS